MDDSSTTPDTLTTSDTAKVLWQQVTARLRAELSDATWRTWLEGVVPGAFHDDELTLAAPHQFARQRLESTYAERIQELASEVTGRPVRLGLVVADPQPAQMPTMGPIDKVAADGPAVAAQQATGGAPAPAPDLQARYTFDHFVIGASNRFSHPPAMSVAEKPGRSYNPLFIYGDSGLGKTHLLHAVGHHVRQLFVGKRVRYVSTEQFLNDFIEMIRTNSQQRFKRAYREVDVLLIDDVQFMSNHERLQEEFFNTFDSLYGSGAQIVLSSDRSPKVMATLEDRLRTRFEWGLITEVKPPEFETRFAILRHRVKADAFCDVPDAVLAFIATHITNNVRELEGALIRVVAYASLSGTPITEESAREVLANLLDHTSSRVITPDVIFEETAKMYGFTIDDLCGRSRRKPLVIARQIGMYVFRELTEYSYPQIAREFGGRDHTTVMHAVEKITSLMKERRVIFDQVTELISRIKTGDPR